MQSILGKTEFEFIEKKSRFIGILYHVEDVDQIDDLLTEVKNQYPGANHYVYAYIIDEFHQKASDDGEPQRTAGYPILDVLSKNNLYDCLAIVVRYFGGTKLGSGGLIRAYSHTISETIKKATLIKKVTQYYCSLKTNYEHLGDIERYIREHTTLDKVDYTENIHFNFYVYEAQLETVRNQLYNLNQYQDLLVIENQKSVYTKVSH